MESELKQAYRGIEIVYVERSDKWNFTVNGRERNSDSLAQAKASIDRSLDYERKEKPWQPFAAYYKSYTGIFESVTVTSEADKGGYGSGSDFWISRVNGADGKKERSKESEFNLYASTPENDAAVTRWLELKRQIKTLQEQQQEIVNNMARLTVPESEVK